MSAPQIPNLLAGRGRGRGRGRGGNNRGGMNQGGVVGPFGISLPPPPPPARNSNPQDRVIQRTDIDASDSRMSAVLLGYLNDEYATHFNKNPVRRLPLINRGKPPPLFTHKPKANF